MADGTIDSLNIQISSDANRAVRAIDSLQKKLGGLNSALNGLNVGGLPGLSSGVAQLSHAMSAFKSGEIKTADFTRIATGLNKLSAVNVQGVSDASRSISTLTSNLSELKTISFDSGGIENIAGAIAKLGRASVTEATQNLEFLKSSVAEFVSGMNGIGSLNFGTDNLYKLVSSVSRLGSKTATQSVKNLPQISTYLRDFVTSMNSVGSVTFNFDGLEKLVANISRLGGAKATQSVKNLEPIKKQLLRFIDGLNGIGALKFDMTGLNELVGAISKLGGKAAGNSIKNIEQLGPALKQLMATLSTAPRVSQNLIDMTNALGNLAKNGSRVSTASRAMQNGLNGFSMSARTATKHTRGLVSQIGLFYAKFFLLIRGAKGLGKAAKSAMDYIETLNYFNSAFRQVAQNADVSDWEKYGHKSAEAYANSFEARSKQLTQKLTGFTVSDEGDLSRTGMPSLGLDPNKVLQYQATFAQMASSMGVASEQSLKLSNALTMIGADLASVRNMEFEDVWRDMSSGMVGMSRTLDKYGVNIRNVNLQQELYNLGIDRSIAKLNQQDKAVLRTIVLLNSTQYAWGDLARTINQPANSLRLMQSNFASLARTLGALFIPIISKVLPYINALVIALQRLFAWIGGLLGVKLSGFTSSVGGAAVEMGDFADSADGAAGSLGDANKEAKKLKGNLQSFDELNTISINDDTSGKGEGAGGGGGGIPELDAALDTALAEYQAAWDAAFANMENRANELADKVVGAFKRIWDTAEPTREALKRLWDEGLAQLGNFTWTALKDFWNEFLVPLGNWSLGTGFPMLIDAVNNFLTSINWTAINDALRNFWQALEPFAEKVGEGLIQFFDDLLQVGAKFINFTVPNGLNSIAEAIKKIDPQTAKDIGYGLGILGTSLIAFKGIKTIAGGLGALATNFGKFFKVAGIAKYSAIALGIGGVVLALDKFGYIKVNWKTLSSAFKKLAEAIGKFAVGIGKGLLSFVDGLLKVMSPALEGLINGFAWALDGLGSILEAIPEGVISSVTQVLTSFFAAFLTYKAVIVVGGLISTLASNLRLFASALPGIVNSGPILSNLAMALGPTALGGIAFTAIGGGLLLIAQKMAQVTEEAAKNSAIGQFSQAISELNDEVSQKTSQIQTSLANTRHDLETTGVAESQVAKDLAAEYENLSSKSGLTADEQARMRDISSQLVELVPGLSKYIDEQTGYLDIQNQTLEDLIENQELYAQKQAAEGLLVDAYKQQYEATNNVTKAQNAYNEAVDQYLTKAGLAPAIIRQIKDGVLDLDQADIDFANSPNNFLEKYGVSDMATLREAYDGLSDAISKNKNVLEDAKQTVADADENLDLVQGTITTVNEALEKNNQDILNDVKSSAEFQQALSDLGEEFKNLGVAVSDEFLDKLALDDTGLADDVISMFDTLKNQTEISGEEIKQMFDRLGYDIPKEFANTLSQQTPEVRVQFAALFADLSAGVPADSEELKSAFEVLGYDLPNELMTALSSKEAGVQAKTIELLGKIEGGKKLAEGNLIEVFKNLGINVPGALIESLTSDDVTADTQKAAIELLGQIKSASDSERQPLIDEFNKLGVGVADEGVIKALDSKQDDTKTSVLGYIKNGIKDVLESEKSPVKTESEGIGKNIVDGTNKGIEENQGSTKGVIGTWVSNITGWFKGFLGIKSPSKVFGEFGLFTVEGFNNGISNNMKESFSLMQQWSKGVSKSFDIPSFSTGYEINRNLLDTVDVQYRSPGFNAQKINSQLDLSLAGDIGELIAEIRRQNELLEVIANKPVIDKNDIGGAYISYAKDYRKQTGKQLGISY